MATINLGKVRITDKGVWVPDYAGGYGILDVVTFKKGSYMSKVSANSAALTDRASWVPFVDTASIELAIQEAMDAAGEADEARLAIQDDLALKANQTDLAQLAGDVKDTTEKAGAASLAELNARLLALEKIVSSTLRSKIEVTREFNVWGKTNLILYGDGANTKAPDFIGQKYIDTTNSNVYVAVGNSNAGNWKLV